MEDAEVDRKHRQYAGALDEVEAAAIVTGAVGQSGANEEYVLNTVEHLIRMWCGGKIT